MTTTDATGNELPGEVVRAGPQDDAPPGIGPYQLAWRRLRRNKVALAFGALFLVICVMCLLAPAYAKHIAHTGPAENHVTDQIRVNGKLTDVVSTSGIPI